MAVASQWAARIMTVSVEMVFPGLVGYWIDEQLGITPLLTVLGFGLGITLAIRHLLVMTAVKQATKQSSDEDEEGKPRR